MSEVKNIVIEHAWAIAIVCIVFCFVITGIQVGKHLANYTNPYFQNKIITILFMAPIYAFFSSMTIWTHDIYGYFNLFRDLYEAVLIYAFFELLRCYIAYDPELKLVDEEKIFQILSTKGVQHHIPPMNYFRKPIRLISDVRGRWFFSECKKGVLQFMVVNVFCTLILVITQALGGQDEITGFAMASIFISTCFSLYYLILFYQIMNKELNSFKPLLKFLSVKGVLFFTYWQQMFLAIFSNQIAALLNEDEKTTVEVLEGLLVCFEMVVLSSLTAFAFSYKDFKQAETANSFFKKASVGFLATRLVQDVISSELMTTVDDLKLLAEPFRRESFAFKKDEALKTSFHSTEAEENEQKSVLFDKIVVIPDSLGNKVDPNENQSSNMMFGGNSMYQSGHGGLFSL